MSTNPDEKHSGCCGGAKPDPHKAQQPTQAAPGAKAEESVTPPPQTPTAPQSKSKGCCG